jgi:hypothetical protein
MCCTLLFSSAAAGEIGAYQQVSREMNPGRKQKGFHPAFFRGSAPAVFDREKAKSG